MVPRIPAHVRRTPRSRLVAAFSITAILAGALFAALPAFAGTTYYVNDDSSGTGDCATASYSTVAGALAVATTDGDIIRVCPGTYTSDGGAITAGITIEGVNADGTNTSVSSSGVALLDGQFTIAVAKTIVIRNLSIGGTSATPGSTGVCQAIQHTAPGSGFTTLELTNLNFSYNECTVGTSGAVGTSGGAAVSSTGALSLDITDSSFLGNAVLDALGGAIKVADPVAVSIEGSGFTDNIARVTPGAPGFALGGALAVFSATASGPFPVSISDTDFTGNGAGGDFDTSPEPEWFGGAGGAVFAENTALVLSGDSAFSGNIVPWQGGAIWLGGTGSTLDVDADAVTGACPSFSGNYADNTSGAPTPIGGGAIYAAGDVSLTCATFSENGFDEGVATDFGGALYVEGDLDIAPTHDVTTEEPVTFVGNIAALDGGAIYVDPASAIDVRLSGVPVDPEALLFQRNLAGRSGGAVSVGGASAPVAVARHLIEIADSAFYANRAGVDRAAGGGGAIAIGEGIDLTITGTTWFGWPFGVGATVPSGLIAKPGGWIGDNDYGTDLSSLALSGNRALCADAGCSDSTDTDPATNLDNSGGGAILFRGAGDDSGLTIGEAEAADCPVFTWNRTRVNIDFDGNEGVNMGGAIALRAAAGADPHLEVVCGTFTSNRAAQGGAIYALDEATVDVTSATFTSNFGYIAGGAIRVQDGALDVATSRFEQNATDASTGGGGAILADGLVTLTTSTFSGNGSGAVGGAVAVGNYVTITESLFVENSSGQHGGAIYANDGLEVSNSTFTGNAILGIGAYSGAAIYTAASDIDLVHVTVADQAEGSGNDGSVLRAAGSLNLTNTIVKETNAFPRCVAGSKTDNGGNVVAAGCSGFGAASTFAAIDLQALADNGGPTETMALGTGSVAIDHVAATAGDCSGLDHDQRGLMRPYSDASSTPCDAGAYEARYTVTTSAVSSDTLAMGETVDDDVSVDGYLDQSGLIDPQGSVQFSYCYDADSAPVWGACTATDIGTAVDIVASGIAGGFSTVSLSDVSGFSGGWDPAADADGDGPGYYLLHAEYIPHADGDAEAPEPSRYEASEDDGTNEAFTYDLATDVTTTTTTRVSRSEITFGQSVRDVATVVADEGTDDPTGDVEFSYCFDASAAPTWGSCTPVAVGTVTLAGGVDTADGTSTAQSGLVTPDAVGYYLFHAEYLGDTGFEGSEDDGTNELVHVAKAATFVDLTSGTYFSTAGSVPLTGTLVSPSACLVGRTITFKQDTNGDGTYESTIGTGVTNGSGSATFSSLSTSGGSIYEIELSTEETANCLGTVNTATIVVAGTGDAANGGGHYVNSGRINFGFTVQKKTNPKTGITTITGQMTWHKQGANRLKGTITGYTTSGVVCPTGISGTCALITGTASYYRWDGVGGKWTLVSSGVGFRILVSDGGIVTTCVKKTCTTSARADYFAMDIPSIASVPGESTTLLPLKGGSIIVK